MNRTVICFDGVGTDGRTAGSVLAPCVDRIAAKIGADTRWFPWGGSTMLGMGGGGTWADNSRAGVTDLVAWMDANPAQHIVLMSFSGGSKPAHDFLDQHPRFHNRVLAAGFLSDPWRPRDRWQTGLAYPGGWGVCGENYTPISDRAWWTAVPGDIIPNAQPDSLLRYFADVSYGGPDQIITEAIRAFQQGRFQLAAHLGLPLHERIFGLGRRINDASTAVHRYLNGWHTRHYLGPVDTDGGDHRSLSDRLADSVAWGVNRRYPR